MNDEFLTAVLAARKVTNEVIEKYQAQVLLLKSHNSVLEDSITLLKDIARLKEERNKALVTFIDTAFGLVETALAQGLTPMIRKELELMVLNRQATLKGSDE